MSEDGRILYFNPLTRKFYKIESKVGDWRREFDLTSEVMPDPMLVQVLIEGTTK